MRIRPAQPDDAAAIARIHVAAWQAAYAGIIDAAYLAALSTAQRETYWAQAIVQGRPRLLLAQDGDGAVAGWIAFGDCRDKDAPATRGEIWAIYVDPARWSQGVGQALWQQAREWLLEQGKADASLWVLASNQRAIRFYAALGFVPDPGSDRTITVAGAPIGEVRQVCPLAQGG
ncbi:GNAT family N-acetyltransferase [Acidovorax sp. Root219]|uniref:GNAT family N-acetyltransferase n=1 Tax=Acidovorax sp. Root219 TaxID=1736493 RepID=UPI0007103AC3|nr:GNAT family N-acetyltransferase [Acidovorax sp. Root219]KRC30488.1 GNAT family acetyltransferase [Acidovorax sp. Root219]